MRNDCTIKRASIVCQNATLICGARKIAQPGDLVVYDNGAGSAIGRVLGTVKPHDEKQIYVLVLTLSSDARFAYERWVLPGHVREIHDTPTRFAAWFFSPDLTERYTANEIRRLSDYGTLTDSFIDRADARVAEWRKPDPES